jgi:hypothetical protein
MGVGCEKSRVLSRDLVQLGKIADEDALNWYEGA